MNKRLMQFIHEISEENEELLKDIKCQLAYNEQQRKLIEEKNQEIKELKAKLRDLKKKGIQQ